MSESKFPPVPEASKSGLFDCEFTFSRQSQRDLTTRFASLIQTDIPEIKEHLRNSIRIAETHPALKKGPDSERNPTARAKGAS